MWVGKDKVGTTIEYTLREKVDAPGGSKVLAQLSSNFQYEVLDVCGAIMGRAIVLRPVEDADAVYVAFRGMRIRGRTPEEDLGPSLDRRCLAQAVPTKPSWLTTDEHHHVHAGVQSYHNTFWQSGLKKTLEVASPLPRPLRRLTHPRRH